MRISISRYSLLQLSAVLLSTPVLHASPSPADSVLSCGFDHEEWRLDRLLPAAKRAANLNVGEPRTVRLIYFLPNDRAPQQVIDAKIDSLIRDIQQSYAEVMEFHGFGSKTFTFETDGDGKAVVHHVKGKFNDAYYHTDTFRKVIYEETAEQFDLSRNIYFVVLDDSTATIDGYCGQGGRNGPEGGVSLIPAPNIARLQERGWSCFNVSVAAHELGHAFGLAHDHFRNVIRSRSAHHTDWMVTSFCAAEWLDVHRYFNNDEDYPERGGLTTIQMFPPLAVPPSSVRLRFGVTDPDGLHQAQLHNSTGEAIDCQGISGESATVEFVTTEVTEAGNWVWLRVVDAYGNATGQRYEIDIAVLPPPEVVSIPDANLAAVVRETLGLVPGDAVRQLDMLRLGGLEAPHRQITDLTGLEHAVNLKGLSLGENQIRAITPLEGLTILEWLELPDNNISDISSLAGMTNLSRLNLSDNSVSDLTPLTDLYNLSILWFYNNSVSDLTPLAGLTHLVELDFSGNSVSDLSPLAGLSHLSGLGLSDNSVSDLSPLAGLTRMIWINLSGNSVSDLSPLVGLTHLAELFLWNNPLSYTSIDSYIPALNSRGVAVHFDERTARTPDFDGNGTVGMGDFLQFAAAFGLSQGDDGYDAKFDLDGDNVIGFSDLLIFAAAFGQKA